MRAAPLTTLVASLGLTCVLAQSARAQTDELRAQGRPDEPPRPTPATAWAGRLELRGALTARDEAVRAPATTVNVAGSAVTQAGIAGTYFPGRGAFGLSGRVDVDRVGLRGNDPTLGRIDIRATGIDASVGGAARWRANQAFTLEAHLGYGMAQVPLVRVENGQMPVSVSQLRTHGPVLGVVAGTALSDWLLAELSARASPVTFGGKYADSALGLRRLTAGANVAIGRVDVRNVRFAALLGYELAGAGGDGGGLDVSQLQHRVGFGVRAFLGAPPLPATASAPAPPPRPSSPPEPPPPPAPKPVPPSIRGVVRMGAPGGAPGPGIAGATVELPGGRSAFTGADGVFVLKGLSAGPAPLRIVAEGYAPGEEVVAVPGEGEVAVEIFLRKSDVATPASISGLVRDESGAPLTATVRIVELSLDVRADAKGFFRLQVPAGRYTLLIEADGLVPQRKRVRADAGEQIIHNVDLQRRR